MTYGILIGYSIALTLVIGVAVWRMRKGKEAPKKPEVPAQSLSMLARIIEEEFGKKGITAKVHEVPSTPEEAIAVYAQAILMAIRDSDAMHTTWFKSLRDKADTNKRDIDAVMITQQTLVKGMTDLYDKVDPPEGAVPGKSKDKFAAYFAYARDNFKLTEPQKKVVDTIIKTLTT